MLLGALVDAGVPFESLAKAAEALNVSARLEMRKVMRGGLSGTKIDVITPESATEAADHSHNEPRHEHEHSHEGHAHSHSHAEPVHKHSHAPHRHLSSILKIIEAAPLSGSAG